MSHFSLGIITKEKPSQSNIEELLAPYDEELQVEEYIGQSREEVLRDYRINLEEERKRYDALAEKNELETKGAKKFLDGTFLKELRMNDDELIEQLRNYFTLDAEGNRMSTYNPNSKWDWYEVGGRWSDELLVNYGAPTNSAQIKNILWDSMGDSKEETEAFWDNHVDGKGKGSTLYSPDYFINRYGTKEKYVEIESQFRTFALLTPDGEWLEEGEMGWFGISSSDTQSLEKYANTFQEMIHNPAYQDYWFTVIDCHI